MNCRSSDYAEVYQVLDALDATGLAYPGAPGILFNAIDRLRLDHVHDEHIRLAEKISVAIVRLEGAMRHGRTAMAAEVRAEIKKLSAAWMDTTVTIAA